MGSRGRDSSVEGEDLLSIIQICEEGKKTCVNCSHQLKLPCLLATHSTFVNLLQHFSKYKEAAAG